MRTRWSWAFETKRSLSSKHAVRHLAVGDTLLSRALVDSRIVGHGVKIPLERPCPCRNVFLLVSVQVIGVRPIEDGPC